MSESQELTDRLYRMRVLRARQMTPGERMGEALRLTEQNQRSLREAVRGLYPEATEGEMLDHCRELMRRIRESRDRGIFVIPE